jgi:hypothetical protein
VRLSLWAGTPKEEAVLHTSSVGEYYHILTKELVGGGSLFRLLPRRGIFSKIRIAPQSYRDTLIRSGGSDALPDQMGGLLYASQQHRARAQRQLIPPEFD